MTKPNTTRDDDVTTPPPPDDAEAHAHEQAAKDAGGSWSAINADELEGLKGRGLRPGMTPPETPPPLPRK